MLTFWVASVTNCPSAEVPVPPLAVSPVLAKNRRSLNVVGPAHAIRFSKPAMPPPEVVSEPSKYIRETETSWQLGSAVLFCCGPIQMAPGQLHGYPGQPFQL